MDTFLDTSDTMSMVIGHRPDGEPILEIFGWRPLVIEVAAGEWETLYVRDNGGDTQS